jgi:hypothetical protein
MALHEMLRGRNAHPYHSVQNYHDEAYVLVAAHGRVLGFGGEVGGA